MAKEEKLADRIIWDGIRILNRHYRVEAFIVARPDTICGVCSGWEHGEHSCAFPKHPRCALCADEHQCTVGAGRGMYCPHMAAKRANCGGNRRAHSSLCPKTKEAQEKARGWRCRVVEFQRPMPAPSLENQKDPEGRPRTPRILRSPSYGPG